MNRFSRIACLFTALAFTAACTSPLPSPAQTPLAAESTSVSEKPTAPATEQPAAEPYAVYLDPNVLTEARVADLLARMTIEEKIGQMTQVEKGSIQPGDITARSIGSVLSGGGGSPATNSPEAWAKMVDGFQAAALKTRLRIPLIYGVDAVHGHNNLDGAVIFPHNIGLGAANDPALMEKIGRATAEEMAGTGIRWNFAPVVAVVQDIRWGRTYESYSEKTELVTSLATAYIRGQQNASGLGLGVPPSVLTTPKHFIGDGATVWGSSVFNNYKIDQGDMQLDEAALRQYFLPPYQAAIEAGAESIMVSFSSWNGTRMHAQKYLLTDVLKNELGFKGFLISDWQAIDQISGETYQNVVIAINAGLDMIMVPYDYKSFISNLSTAVQKGDVSMVRIDDAVRRILTVKFDLGLFESPYSDEALRAAVGSAEHRAIAREAVAKSLVLLKNDNQALPIAKDTPTIFVSGKGAADIGIQCGGWTIEWQGKSGKLIHGGTTILDALKAAAGQSQVEYHPDGNFEKLQDANGAPLKADVGMVVVGESPYAEGVGDRADLVLSAADQQLIQRMRAHSEKLIVILLSGRPMIITAVLDQADAWVAAWLPGSEGQGVTDVLFGDRPFTGKLSFSWPASMDQVPLGPAYPQALRQKALFPLGFGLTD